MKTYDPSCDGVHETLEQIFECEDCAELLDDEPAVAFVGKHGVRYARGGANG